MTFSDEAKHREMIERGYCTAPLLSAAEVAGLLDAVRRIRPSLEFDSPTTGSILYHASFLDPDLEYRRKAYEIVCEALTPKLKEMLPEYHPIAGGLLVKSAGTGEVGMHCDWTSTSDTADVNIAVWCPLVDVDDDNGALRVIPGSQKLVPNVVAARLGGYWTDYLDELKAMTEPVPLKAGEAIFFDVSLLHWSRTNSSSALRPVANLLFVHRDAQPVLYVADEACERLEVFDMSEGRMIEHSASQLFRGDVQAPSLGSIANPNIRIPFDEFKRRLARRTGPQAPQPSGGPLRRWMSRMLGA
jgi:hypothetical protein